MLSAFMTVIRVIDGSIHTQKDSNSHENCVKQKSESIAQLRIHQASAEERANKLTRPASFRYFVFPEHEHEHEHRNCYREYLEHIIGH